MDEKNTKPSIGGDVTCAPGPTPATGWRNDPVCGRDLGPLRIESPKGVTLFQLDASGEVQFCGTKAGMVPSEALDAFVWTVVDGAEPKLKLKFPGPGRTTTFSPGPGGSNGQDGIVYFEGCDKKTLVAFGPGDELRGPDDEPLTAPQALAGFKEFLRQFCGVDSD